MTKYLMCSPDHFTVSYSINPWMFPSNWKEFSYSEDDIKQEWYRLYNHLSQTGDVKVMPGVKGLPDLVFTANAAVIKDGKALLANFKHPERQPEHQYYRRTLEELNFKVSTLPDHIMHEGAGDAIWDQERDLFWIGFGQRSDWLATEYIEDTFEKNTVALELIDPRFYHLDTCFNVLSGGHAIYFPSALSIEARARIKKLIPEDKLYAISHDDAYVFSANAVSVDGKVYMSRCSDSLRAKLEEWGYIVVDLNLSAFHKSGGSAFCLTLRLDW